MKPLGHIDEARIRQIMEYWQVPGMALGVIRDGEPDEIQCFGWRESEKSLRRMLR